MTALRHPAGRERTPAELRRLGTLALMIGLFLTVLGTALGILVGLTLLGLEVPAHWLPEGTRYDAAAVPERSPWVTIGSVAAVFLTLMFGLTGMMQGGWQVITGRQNARLARLMMLLLNGFLLLAFAAAVGTGKRIGQHMS